MFQLPDKVDHVFTHWTAMDLVKISSSLKPGILCLHLLHHLLPEAAHLGRHLDGHVLVAFVSNKNKCENNFKITAFLSSKSGHY